MKKTLLLLTLSASLLGLSYAADSNSTTDERPVTLTFSTEEPAGSNNGGGYQGIVFTLSNDPSRFSVICNELTDVPSFSTFDLQSISLKVRSGQSWGATGAYIVDTSNTVLAHANNTIQSALGGTMVTFDFDNLTLNEDATYRLFLISTDHLSDADLTVGTTMTAAKYSSRQLAAYDTGSSVTTSECGFTRGLAGTTADNYAPVVSIQGQVLIPEPTTATLSLLALAGLAARRRRK